MLLLEIVEIVNIETPEVDHVCGETPKIEGTVKTRNAEWPHVEIAHILVQ